MQRFERRRHYLCDRQVQTALLRQLLYYWFLGTGTIILLTVGYQATPLVLSGNSEAAFQLWGRLIPVLLASVAVAPFVVLSAIRFSNRFVGPMLRTRRVLDQLAAGDLPDHPIVLRDHDYWTDLATQLNAVTDRLRCDTTDPVADRNSDAHHHIPVGAVALSDTNDPELSQMGSVHGSPSAGATA